MDQSCLFLPKSSIEQNISYVDQIWMQFTALGGSVLSAIQHLLRRMQSNKAAREALFIELATRQTT
jgi:hypothetical protein